MKQPLKILVLIALTFHSLSFAEIIVPHPPPPVVPTTAVMPVPESDIWISEADLEAQTFSVSVAGNPYLSVGVAGGCKTVLGPLNSGIFYLGQPIAQSFVSLKERSFQFGPAQFAGSAGVSTSLTDPNRVFMGELNSTATVGQYKAGMNLTTSGSSNFYLASPGLFGSSSNITYDKNTKIATVELVKEAPPGIFPTGWTFCGGVDGEFDMRNFPPPGANPQFKLRLKYRCPKGTLSTSVGMRPDKSCSASLEGGFIY